MRGEQVTAIPQIYGLPVGYQFVGHTAGLGAFTAVGAAAAEGFAREALAGVGHAQRPVNEHLQGKGRWASSDGLLITLGRLDGLDFADRILAGQHHQLASQRAGEIHAGRAGDRELRRSVDREIRRDFADQSANTDVLDSPTARAADCSSITCSREPSRRPARQAKAPARSVRASGTTPTVAAPRARSSP